MFLHIGDKFSFALRNVFFERMEAKPMFTHIFGEFRAEAQDFPPFLSCRTHEHPANLLP